MYKKIFTILFMAALLGFSGINMLYAAGGLKHELDNMERPKKLEDVKSYTLSIDNLLATNLLFGNTWNEVYANVYNALGKNEENSFAYVRDKDGMLYTGNFWNTPPVPMKEYALRVKRLQMAAEYHGAKLVVLLYPTQYNEAWSDGYMGIPYNDYNELGDELVSYFRYYGIDYIDYKQIYLGKEMEAEEIFYKTDHHWRVEVAFDGFGTMVNYLNDKFDEKLDSYYTDINNYNVETYKDVFVGSQGRDAGVSYVGLDDYTYILPKFETDYKYTYKKSDGKLVEEEGSMDETLVSKSYLEHEDYYDKDMYSSYLGGVRLWENIVNNKNEDGLKVLFLRDSYTSPLATFFSSYCSEMDLVWTVQTSPEEIEEAVETIKYDYVFLGLAIDSYIGYGAEFYLSEVYDNE